LSVIKLNNTITINQDVLLTVLLTFFARNRTLVVFAAKVRFEPNL